MEQRTIYCIFVFFLLMMTIPLSSVDAKPDKEDPNKDTDKDGIPDYLDNEKSKPNNSPSNSTKDNGFMMESYFQSGNWSFEYGSDDAYGAWVGDVYWNNSYYIYKANVPWVKIDGIKYNIPGDFVTEEVNCVSLSNYYLAYQLYSKEIEAFQHTIEILWKFYKNSVNNAGKIDVSIQHSVYNVDEHSLFVPIRVDFDIHGGTDDTHLVFGTTGWSEQNSEAFQFTYNPSDKIWGMKVKQQKYANQNAWGGIKAWSTIEKNYLLKYQPGEYKGNPASYVNEEDTYRTDDVLWTTASISGTSPLVCGPTLFVH